MSDSTAVIEMIRRIIADDTADLRERVQHMEAKITVGVEHTEMVDNHREDGGDSPLQPEPNTELQDRLNKIKALHRLDATPVQWTRDNTGKMVEAPEGIWEISCLACNYTTTWKQGNDNPPQCPTWLIADGQ